MFGGWSRMLNFKIFIPTGFLQSQGGRVSGRGQRSLWEEEGQGKASPQAPEEIRDNAM